ncbi:MAG: transglycosylase SLT domain-containing protein [Pseudomonadota bacterium]
MQFKALLIGALLKLPGLLAGAVFICSAQANTLSTARQEYGDAMQAIDRGRWTEYEQIRPALEDYPLAIYLDYWSMVQRPASVRPADVRRFVSLSQDSPLPNRYLGVYLERAGRDKRWGDFLAAMPDEPNSIDLKCYYFRAQLAAGNRDIAWSGAEDLWVYGESRPDECDPLFDAWMGAGQLRDELVWQRMLLVFDERKRSLLGYVARQGSPALKPWSDKLLTLNRRPDSLRQIDLPASDARSAELVSHAIPYYARYKPENALADWRYWRGRLAFDEAQVRRIEHALVLRSLFARSEANLPWVDDALARLSDDYLLEIRLRWAVSEGDWAAVEGHIGHLGSDTRKESVWRYWLARAHEEMGKLAQARAELESLALERGYYSFMAADHLGREYAFEHQTLALSPQQTKPFRELPAVLRIEELFFHEEDNLAHSEWFKVLTDTEASREKQELALLARQQGWHRLAIDAANKAKAWDLLDLRFPMPYENTFEQHASIWQVPATELMAIARRESAFYAKARSPVGARGLMQIMPATGKQVARGLGEAHTSNDLYEVEHNVLLGSAYYRQLLDRYDGNRVFALAAYNAGPHRVDRWRKPEASPRTIDQWIEAIPFKETRNYVQAVLSYNVVFQYLQGDSGSLLSQSERNASY